jgi:pimeloyl-ACP methyl ester carboxylesterase
MFGVHKHTSIQIQLMSGKGRIAFLSCLVAIITYQKINGYVVEEFQRAGFTSSNCELSYVDFGNPDKPDLILLHGMRDHALGMLGIAQSLVDDYHVIAPDLRGHGQSENPGIYTMVQFVADIRALINHCGLNAPVIIGHSLGGHIASRYAAIFPDEVLKLVLLEGMGPPINQQNPERAELLGRLRDGIDTVLAMPYESRSMIDETEAIMRLTRSNPRLQPDLARMIVAHGTEADSGGGIRWMWDPAVDMIWHTFSHQETETLWGWVDCPVLIVTGADSLTYWSKRREQLKNQTRLFHSVLEKRAKIFRHAQHRVIKDAGHMLHYDQPDETNSIVRAFLYENT